VVSATLPSGCGHIRLSTERLDHARRSRSSPLGTLAAFPGPGITDERIGTPVTAVNERRAVATPGPRQR